MCLSHLATVLVIWMNIPFAMAVKQALPDGVGPFFTATELAYATPSPLMLGSLPTALVLVFPAMSA